MVQYSSANGDITVTQWADQASGTTDIFNSIDEATPNDSDWIESAANQSATYISSLSAVTDPTSSSGHILRVRHYVNASNKAISWRYMLRDNGIGILTISGDQTIGTSAVTVATTLTAGQADAISNYDLLQFYAEVISATAGNHWHISWMQLEVPSAGPTTYNATYTADVLLNDNVDPTFVGYRTFEEMISLYDDVSSQKYYYAYLEEDIPLFDTLGRTKTFFRTFNEDILFSQLNQSYGYPDVHDAGQSIEDTIRGMQIVAPATGFVTSIGAYVSFTKGTGPDGKAKAALYSGNSLLAESTETTIDAVSLSGYVYFPLTTPYAIQAGSTYNAVVWASLNAEYTFNLVLDTTPAVGWAKVADAEVYGSWPQPANFTVSTLQAHRIEIIYDIWNDTLTTTVGAGEAPTQYYRTLTADLTLYDTYSDVWNLSRAYSETITPYDDFDSTSVWLKTFEEVTTLYDTLTSIKSFVKIFEEAVILYDTINAQWDISATLTEVISLADTANTNWATNKLFNELITIYDVLDTTGSQEKELIELITLYDNLDNTLSITKTFNEILTLYDIFSSTQALSYTYEENIILYDTLTRGLSLSVTLDEFINLYDTLTTQWDVYRTLTDEISLTDTREQISVFKKGLTESIIIYDECTPQAAGALDLSETITIYDELNIFIGSLTFEETIIVEDVVSKGSFLTFSEFIPFVEVQNVFGREQTTGTNYVAQQDMIMFSKFQMGPYDGIAEIVKAYLSIDVAGANPTQAHIYDNDLHKVGVASGPVTVNSQTPRWYTYTMNGETLNANEWYHLCIITDMTYPWTRCPYITSGGNGSWRDNIAYPTWPVTLTKDGIIDVDGSLSIHCIYNVGLQSDTFERKVNWIRTFSEDIILSDWASAAHFVLYLNETINLSDTCTKHIYRTLTECVELKRVYTTFFGKQSTGATSTYIDNAIVFGKFQMGPTSGIARSITALVADTQGGSSKAKAHLYNDSLNTIGAETVEVWLPIGSFQWTTFTLSDDVPVVANQWYYIAIQSEWFQYGQMRTNGTGGSGWFTDAGQHYPNWANPLTKDTSDSDGYASIYCTYDVDISSDILTLLLNRTFTENITLNDTFSKNITFNKVLSETITLEDATVDLGELSEEFSETVTLYDTFGSTKTLIRIYEETLTLYDTLTTLLSGAATYSETINLFDTLEIQKTFQRALAEDLISYDSVDTTTTLFRTLEENITLFDTYSGLLGGTKTLTELITLYDEYTDQWTLARTYQESITIYDEIEYQQTLIETLSETLAIEDTYSRTWTLSREYVELVTIQDTYESSAEGEKLLSEVLQIYDTYTDQWILSREYEENITLYDVVDQVIRYSLSLEEVATLYDNYEIVGLFTRTLIENISIYDSLSYEISGVRTLSDSVLIYDTFDTEWLLAREYTETITLYDTLTRFAGVEQNITETLTIYDDLTTVVSYHLTISEWVPISSTINTLGTYIRTFSDVVTITDAFTVGQELIEIISENITLYDSITTFVTYSVNITELISLYDEITTDTGRLSQLLEETITLYDTYSRTFTGSLEFDETITLYDEVTPSDFFARIYMKLITDRIGSLNFTFDRIGNIKMEFS